MTATVTPARRPDPRRARTRAALVDAGRRLLAEGRTAVSIQEITELAGVGFGSFSNHFASKDALFQAAVEEALDTWGELRDAAVEGIEDPAEVFATSLRMIGRVQRDIPEHVRVLLNVGTSVLMTDRGIRPRALHDLEAGMEAGLFAIDDPELALALVGGALLGALQEVDAHPERDAGAVSDELAQRVLLMLGVPASEATRLTALPLPVLPEIS